MKSLHKKIIELTNNSNIEISSQNLKLLDSQTKVQFTNNGILGDFPGTPSPQTKIAFNPKEWPNILQKIKSSENTNGRKPIQKAFIRGLNELVPPQLGGVLKSKRFEMNSDKLIEEMLSKRYDQQNILEALRVHYLEKNDIDFGQNEFFQHHCLEDYLGIHQTSLKNLKEGNGSEDRNQNSSLRFNYLKSRSKDSHRVKSMKSEKQKETRMSLAQSFPFKKPDLFKALDINDDESTQEYLRPYTVK